MWGGYDPRGSDRGRGGGRGECVKWGGGEVLDEGWSC